MGSSSADLLRMLEPLVRPGNLAGRAPASPPPQEPIETRSFESLLFEAQQMAVGDAGPDEQGPARCDDALAPLAQVDAIENASLRTLVSQAHQKRQ